MRKLIIHIMIVSLTAGFVSCGKLDILKRNDYATMLSVMAFSSSGSEPSGDDVISSSTNQSDKDELKAPKLNAYEGAAFVRPPQINNYGTVTLSYTVDVPPGRRGMQPGVGLSYSSSGGDGLAGIGWRTLPRTPPSSSGRTSWSRSIPSSGSRATTTATKYETRYGYDLLFLKTKIIYPVDPKMKTRLTAVYAYCAMGAKSLTVSNDDMTKQIVTDISYNEFGQMTAIMRGNGTVTTYTYDVKGRLDALLTTASHNGQTWKVQDVKYDFKVDNSIASVENTPDVAADGAGQSAIRYEYQYDGLNRLVHARGTFLLGAGLNPPLTETANTVNEDCNQNSTPSRLEELLARYEEPVRAIVHRTLEEYVERCFTVFIQGKIGTEIPPPGNAVIPLHPHQILKYLR